MLNTPGFWYQQRPNWMARVLLPLGWLYGVAVAIHRRSSRPLRCGLPVVSIGNLTLGGTGKTPLGIALAQGLDRRGWRVAVLLRGHGSRPSESRPVGASSRVEDVGDEALEYRRALGNGKIWVGSNRRRSVALAKAAGADLILLDDGMQHWPIARDLDVSLLDAHHQLGNRLVFPAGPLREPRAQLARADLLVLTEADSLDPAASPPPEWPAVKPWFAVRFCLEPPPQLMGIGLVAFCGIGLPQKFFAALRYSGLELLVAESFPDHHVYADRELHRLLDLAAAKDALLVTTVKDGQRLPDWCKDRVILVPMRVDHTSMEPLLGYLEQHLVANVGRPLHA